MRDTGIGLAVVVGIGINLQAGSFPAKLVDLATSLDWELDVDDPYMAAAKTESELCQRSSTIGTRSSID